MPFFLTFVAENPYFTCRNLCTLPCRLQRNGRELKNPVQKYEEKIDGVNIVITVWNPNTRWQEWIKTIGSLVQTDKFNYTIKSEQYSYEFYLKESDGSISVMINANIARENPKFIKVFKNVFRKTAYCVKCKVCEVNCVFGFLTMNDDVNINDKCLKCQRCHKVDKGCMVYKSVMLPKGEVGMNRKQSLNSYSNHGVKKEWMQSYFLHKDEFKQKHTLGSNMYDFFKRFLRDAELMENDRFTKTASVMESLGIDSNSAWGIILTNLSYAPQIGWYVHNISFNEVYSREAIIQMLEDEDVNETAAKQMLLAFKRIFTETPLGIGIGLGIPQLITKGKTENMVSITRTQWKNPEPKVILYSLYKFAEACGDYYQFTLSRLLNQNVDSNGVSPTVSAGLKNL